MVVAVVMGVGLLWVGWGDQATGEIIIGMKAKGKRREEGGKAKGKGGSQKWGGFFSASLRLGGGKKGRGISRGGAETQRGE
jgi:hypothetical protein